MDLMKYLARVRDGAPKARHWFASPAGTPSGSGSIGDPWDIITALAHPEAVQSGDTIWLRGGTYYGAFVSDLTGTAESPIVVRAYDNERVTFDSNYETTLAENINDSQTSFDVVDMSRLRVLGVFDWLWVGGECIQVLGISGNTITNCTRGFGSSDAASHTAGDQVRKTYGNIDALRAEGGYTWFWGIEFFCSSSERINSIEVPDSSNPYWHPASSQVTTVSGHHGIRFINCVIHDGPGSGINSFSGSDGVVFYGNLIYNVGWDSAADQHGRAIYTQNNNTLKTFKDSIVLGSFRDETTTRMGGSGTSYNNDFLWEGNIFGSGGVIIGDGAGFNDVVWRDNYTYKGEMGFGNIGGNTGTNTGLTVEGSYFGGNCGFYFWNDLAATGNTFRSPLNPYGCPVQMRFASGTFNENLLGGTFENNEYAWTNGVGGAWSNDGPPNCWRVLGTAWSANTEYSVGTRVIAPTLLDGAAKIYVCVTSGTSASSGGPTGTGTNIIDGTAAWDYVDAANGNDAFSVWQARPGAGSTYMDQGSTVTSYAKDTSVTPNRPSYPNAHFLRVNEYDANRAHLVIYNWDRDAEFTVPDATLTGFLSNGDSYRIRNAQDYYTDTWTGTYNGTSIVIDMENRTLAAIHGFDAEESYNGAPSSWVTTFPEFGVFVIEVI